MSFSETGSERGEVRGETREGEIARDDSLPRRGEGRASEFLHVASNYSVCLSELIPIGRIRPGVKYREMSPERWLESWPREMEV